MHPLLPPPPPPAPVPEDCARYHPQSPSPSLSPASSPSPSPPPPSHVDENSSEAEIIAYCKHPPPEQIISQFETSRRVLRLSDSVVVKYGLCVTAAEVQNQICAYGLVDHSIVRIPRVLRFFDRESEHKCWRRGYLLMEYADGKYVQHPTPKQISQIKGMIEHMATIRGPGPGSLGGDRIQGVLFEEVHDIRPGSIEDLNEWVNRRCRDRWVDFTGLNFVLCHMDIAPRNLVWSETGAPWLVDWETAGFVPRLFQYCSHRVYGSDGVFHESVLAALEPLAPDENDMMLAVLGAWDAAQRYC